MTSTSYLALLPNATVVLVVADDAVVVVADDDAVVADDVGVIVVVVVDVDAGIVLVPVHGDGLFLVFLSLFLLLSSTVYRTPISISTAGCEEKFILVR